MSQPPKRLNGISISLAVLHSSTVCLKHRYTDHAACRRCGLLISVPMFGAVVMTTAVVRIPSPVWSAESCVNRSCARAFDGVLCYLWPLLHPKFRSCDLQHYINNLHIYKFIYLFDIYYALSHQSAWGVNRSCCLYHCPYVHPMSLTQMMSFRCLRSNSSCQRGHIGHQKCPVCPWGRKTSSRNGTR